MTLIHYLLMAVFFTFGIQFAGYIDIMFNFCFLNYDYVLLYLSTCIIQFLIFIRTGRAKNESRYVFENWNKKLLFKQIGVSLTWFVWYIIPVASWVWDELKKERIIKED